MTRSSLLFTILVPLFFMACEEEVYTPKPKAYFRIDFPQKSYQEYNGPCPYSFKYPEQSLLDKRKRSEEEYCWMNLHYPQYSSTVHLSYKSINNDLALHIEDARNLAMKHLVKANGIEEKRFENEEKKVYGIVYDFAGNTATNYQFFLTDSHNHFVRGAMYFNLPPNADSLKPVSNFIKQDLEVLIESFEWAKES